MHQFDRGFHFVAMLSAGTAVSGSTHQALFQQSLFVPCAGVTDPVREIHPVTNLGSWSI
jgi:hypothetical protein